MAAPAAGSSRPGSRFAAAVRRGEAPPSHEDPRRRDWKRSRVPSARQAPLPRPDTVERWADLSLPHVASFSYMCDRGLTDSVADIPAREYATKAGDSLQFWLTQASIQAPLKSDAGALDKRLMPTECRERGTSYTGALHATIARRVNGGPVIEQQVKLGEVPIMVRSSRCHLGGLSPRELVGAGEEAGEFGGYFICNGIERIIRMLQLPKRNYPMAITRGAYSGRGPLYSNKGVIMRCVRPDQSGVTLTMHYLTDGSATVRFALRRQEFFLPVIMLMKACVPASDREIYERLCAGEGAANTYLSDRVLLLLRDAKRYESALHSVASTRSFLGARFRAVLDMPASLSDEQAGKLLLDRYVLVHLPTDEGGCVDKFNLLVLMLRKLYGFVRGDVAEDNADSLSNQELLLSGHLLQMVVKEKLAEYLAGIETSLRIQDDVAARASAAAAAGGGSKAGSGGGALPVDAHDGAQWRKTLARQAEPGRRIYNLIATGNLASSSGLDLMQATGFAVVADKINFMRFTTHFRAVHRGAFFAEMKTTTVRKLLPENWGFLCPVHTPDGAPCGLLNHLAAPCSVVAHPMDEGAFAAAAHARSGEAAPAVVDDEAAPAPAPAPAAMPLARHLCSLLVQLGMDPSPVLSGSVMPASYLPVLLDGRLVGGVPPHGAHNIARALRASKALTGGVSAGLASGPAHAPVSDLLRAGVLGLSHSVQAQGGARRTRGGVGAPGAAPGSSELIAAATGSGREGAAGLPPLPRGFAVPPSMEVAFIPPPWWDVEHDPGLAESGEWATAAGTDDSSSSSSGSGGGALLAAISDREAADAAGVGAAASAANAGGSASTSVSRTAARGAKLTGLFAGLFLATTPARLIRPILQLETGLVELVGPLEQLHLDIACVPEDVEEIAGQRLQSQPQQQLPSDGSSGALAISAKAGGGSKRRRAEAGGEGGSGTSAASSSALLAASPASPSPHSLFYRHIELFPHAMLSEVAALTPFSDLNQSPRNMYQCQMGKQTMGTPLHSWGRRTDTKLFRLQNPQAPLVQNAAQGAYALDEYPNGCNAVVAVIAYTGYDMEDACIINKSAYERGFGHASVYKTITVDLQEGKPSADVLRTVFDNVYKRGEAPVREPGRGQVGAADPDDPRVAAAAEARAQQGGSRRGDLAGQRLVDALDADGLPPVGLTLRQGDPLYVTWDSVTGDHAITRHKEFEPAIVEEVRLLAPASEAGAGASGGGGGLSGGGPSVQRVSIKLRINRNPIVGDKLSSRHGQKGVLSYLWPQADMPFTGDGLTPDIIINPHAFPSRMTIGMLVESLAAKAGALHGCFQESTPFRFNEVSRVGDHFGAQLAAAGYSYYGTEAMTSGVTGEPLSCDIYLGVVYYQRLRHMVSDKAQVRATGKVNALTRQPVKGRKKGGGIRFGEMERDSLLAHGASYLLHDRLMNVSDTHIALVCSACGGLLGAHSVPAAATEIGPDGVARPLPVASLAEAAAAGGASSASARIDRARRVPVCRACATGAHVVPVALPYVYRYLANELAGMGVKLTLELGPGPYGVGRQPDAVAVVD